CQIDSARPDRPRAGCQVDMARVRKPPGWRASRPWRGVCFPVAFRRRANLELRGSILIAEPDPTERASLTRVLGGRGYLPFETASQAGALRLARDVSVDLALLDAYFPDGMGLDACEHLCALGRGLRVILMTGDSSGVFRRDAL